MGDMMLPLFIVWWSPIETGTCPLKDDYVEIKTKLLNCDGFIFGL